jgi:hypothetical protein
MGGRRQGERVAAGVLKGPVATMTAMTEINGVPFYLTKDPETWRKAFTIGSMITAA